MQYSICLYARFWHKVLFDLGYVPTGEPFQKLVNQGMIQGRSNFVYRINDTNTFVSYNLQKGLSDHCYPRGYRPLPPRHLGYRSLQAMATGSSTDAEFILEDGKYVCGSEVEKMSKSKLNVISPDDIVNRYGADTLRMYEMFLGPLEQGKPWSTHGIDGVFKFLENSGTCFLMKRVN